MELLKKRHKFAVSFFSVEERIIMVRITGNQYYFDNPDGKKINPKALFPGMKATTEPKDTTTKQQASDTTGSKQTPLPDENPVPIDSTVIVPEGCRRIGSYAETGITLYGLLREECITLAQLIELNPEYFVAENKDKNGNWILREGAILRVRQTTEQQAIEEEILDEGKTFYGSWQIEKSKGAYSIMTKFNLFEEEIKFLNPDIDLNNININDIFNVPGYKFKTSDTLENVAKNHDITVEMLRILNPKIDFTKEIPAGTILNVPKRAGETIIPEEEITLEETSLFDPQPEETTPIEPKRIIHTVKDTETLFKIATNYNVPMWALMLKNNIEDANVILAGKNLEIPTKEEIKAFEAIKNSTKKEIPKEHKIKSGETLSGIAAEYGINNQDLMDWNNIKNANKIRDGQILRLTPPEAKPSEPKKESTEIKYTVKSGDALSVIAENHEVKMSLIMLKNNIQNPKHIQPGDVIIIPSKAEIAELEKKQAEIKSVQEKKTIQSSTANSATKPKKPNSSSELVAPKNKIDLKNGIVVHKIKKGETLKSISEKYGLPIADLRTYNDNLKNIKSTDDLKEKNINSIEIIATPKAVIDATNVSQQFINDLISVEKKHSSLYKDARGIPTIGIGHNTQAHNETSRYQNRQINDNEIYSLLARDIINAQNTLKDTIGETAFNNLSRGQKEALYGLIFNTGGLSDSPKLVAALKAGNYKEAACQMDQAYGGGKVLPGLAKRRFMDIARFIEGSNLKSKDIQYVMETTVQDLYDAGFKNIKRRNNRVDYNAFAKKFLGTYIDKGYVSIIES